MPTSPSGGRRPGACSRRGRRASGTLAGSRSGREPSASACGSGTPAGTAPTSTPRPPSRVAHRGARRGSATHSRPRSSARSQLDTDDREPGADAWRARLRNPHAHRAHGKTLEERIGDGLGERLDQVEAPARRDLADAVRHLAIVDGVLDSIRGARIADVEADVVQELLAVTPLLLEHAVPAEDGETLELEDHLGTAAATVSASTCSRTSWTRKITAPRSYASIAAARLAGSGPVVASGSPRIRPSDRLRERPTSTGRPSATISPSRPRSSKFCSTVLPNPKPGSRQIRSSGMPASTAKRRRSSRKEATSAATSS